MSDFVAMVNNLLWGDGQILIFMLVGAGVFFTFRLGAIQFRHFGHMFSLTKASFSKQAQGISGFQALCTSLSARVGTGNLAGVAVAISLGGPGAIFWMWVIALLGMATGYAESLLGQAYKVQDEDGQFRGGPAYYIRQGLNQSWLAILFSLCLFFGYGFVFSAVQANTITDALNNSYAIATWQSGLVIIFLAGLIVVGGLRAIARFAEFVVPFMAVAYVLVTLVITLVNIEMLPAVLKMIVMSAFGLDEAIGGTFAAAVKNGIQRGLYSNEAGSGSVPHAAAAAATKPDHPAAQGFIQMFGVFIDTLILCTCTAFIILLSGETGMTEMAGIRMTQEAMNVHLAGSGADFVAVAICFFSFTSVVANYAYGESNLHYFHLDNKWGRNAYTAGYLLMILWGSMAAMPMVWAMADMALGLMTVINIIAIIWLSPTIISLSQDYLHKLKSGSDLSYRQGDCPIQGQQAPTSWPCRTNESK